MPERKFCILTKTYRREILAFERLCASIDRFNPDTTHYVLVDRRDLALFARFATARRILVDCEAALPDFRGFNFLGRRYWWRRGRPWIARGWIFQQLAKIEISRTLPEAAVVIFDSDMSLLGPLRPEHVFDGPLVRLYSYPGKASERRFAQWHDIAMQALGLHLEGYTGACYIALPTIWSPANVQAMVLHIERVNDMSWHDMLVRRFRFSEYILHGIFCARFPELLPEPISPSHDSLALSCWDYDLTAPGEIDRFVGDRDDSHVAVLIQSNLNLGSDRVGAIMDRLQ